MGTPSGGAERRHLSVVFCDLVGSTALSTQVDAEELADAIGQYQRVCAEAIVSFDGFVARYLGDGVLAYFGYPLAHEDDPERAVHAALAVVEAVGKLPPLGGRPLEVRIGIASGHVVVGQIGRQSHDVTGESVNLAARLQGVARPNEVMISEATHQFVGDLFECSALEPLQLAGFPRAIKTWRVIGQRERLDRFELRRAAGLTPYINHVAELGALERAWRRTEARKGQVLLVAGEAGIGKSRLLQEFNGKIVGEADIRLAWHGSPYLQNSPLWPVIQHFQHAAGFKPDDDASAKRAKLDALLARGPALPAMSGPTIAAALSLPPAAGDPPLDPDPQQRKRATLAALVNWVTQHCTVRPAVLACEDLHWFDPTTRELLDLLVAQAVDLQLMLILTCRTEFEPRLAEQPHVVRLNLGRLHPDDSLAIASQVVEDKHLSADLLRRIVARSDGVPLFIEELTKASMEAGSDDRTASAAVPITLQDSLVARLDRLPGVKEVAQVGAAIGREFSLTLLHAVLPKPVEQVLDNLDQLVKADLLQVRAEQADRFFVFRHALLQDAAYETLLWSRLRDIHERIADALERLFPDIRDNQPEVLAQHWDRAGKAKNAIRYWERAADRAIERSASPEASAHLGRALHLIDGLPEDPARDALELQIVLKHGAVLRTIQGPQGEGAGHAFERARDLSRRTGDRQALVPALAGLFGYHLVGARNEAANEIAGELLTMAEASGERFSLMLGHRAVGMLALHAGDPVKAREHLEHAMSLYDAAADGPLAFVYGTDHGQTISSFLAMTLWVLGLPDDAIAQENWALDHGRRLNHRYSLAQTDMFRIIRSVFGRDWDAVAAIAKQTFEIGMRHSFSFPTRMSRFHLGFCRTARGDTNPTVLNDMHTMLQTRRGTNYYPLYLLLMAEAQTSCGDLAAALKTIAEAKSVVASTGERLVEPELLRFHGMLLRETDAAQAEVLLRAALSEARRQGARGWEPRAAVSLAEYLAATGRESEARDLVAEVRTAFNQGAATPELRRVEELLTSLAP
jgi:class 3 adenylate cyclase/tetratricopeptide (TPR) repeat protein